MTQQTLTLQSTPDSSGPGTVISGCRQYVELLWTMKVPVGLFYLKLGHSFEGSTLPQSFPRMTPGYCYANAGELALAHPELTYVEGFACAKVPVPVHHAWLVTQDGEVIDPTWGAEPQGQYHGVAYRTEFLMEQVERSRHWGIGPEHLPLDVLSRHPKEYLHPAWAPGLAAQDEVFATFKDRQS